MTTTPPQSDSSSVDVANDGPTATADIWSSSRVPTDHKASALQTPWKVVTEIRRRLTYPYTRMYFAANGVKWGKGWKLFGTPLIQRFGGSKIEIGSGMQWRTWYSSNPVGLQARSILSTCSPDAEIIIGDDAKFSGTRICAKCSIRMGDRVRIGANSMIVDNDFHPIDPQERIESPTAGLMRPVVIEDDVFIGMNVLILKGTVIGKGSLVGAGSIVSGVFPPNSLIAGIPGRVIRKIG